MSNRAGLRDRGVHVGRAGDVARERDGTVGALRTEVEREDLRALREQAPGGGRADPAGGSGDERDAPGKAIPVRQGRLVA